MAKLKNGPLTSLDDVDSRFHELYSQLTDGEHSGKYVLSGVETGYKQTDALNKEAGKYRLQLREANTKLEEANTKLSAWGDMNPEDVKTKVDRVAELEESAKGKVPEAKLNELAEARAVAKMAPLQRELQQTKDKLTTADKSLSEYKTREETGKILDELRLHGKDFDERAFATGKSPLSLVALNTFRVDEQGNVVAKEGSGFTAGLPLSECVGTLLEQNPFFGKSSQGSGSQGSGYTPGQRGTSVFQSDNLTARFKLQKENPAEYDRQWKDAQGKGLTTEFETLKPAGKPA